MSEWNLDLRLLQALMAVDREGSFSRAAEATGYTQSAISQQINRLERIVGQPLVERPGGPRPVTITAAGRILLGHTEAIFARLTSARADLDALADGTTGLLRVGCYQSVGVRILPRVLRAFQAEWPRVSVELTEAEDDGELLDLVERGLLDVSFIVYPLPPGPFAHRELMADPYVVVVAEESDLGHTGSSVSLSDLAGVPIVTYAQMREVHSIESRLGRPNLTEQIVFRSNDNGTILGLAAEGVGAAVITWLSVDPHRQGVRTVPLVGASPRVVGISWHSQRYRIPACDRFIELAAREAVREQELADEQLAVGYFRADA